eukprot:6184559-Pleurochrysis_carterae.AAC.6
MHIYCAIINKVIRIRLASQEYALLYIHIYNTRTIWYLRLAPEKGPDTDKSIGLVAPQQAILHAQRRTEETVTAHPSTSCNQSLARGCCYMLIAATAIAARLGAFAMTLNAMLILI